MVFSAGVPASAVEVLDQIEATDQIEPIDQSDIPISPLSEMEGLKGVFHTYLYDSSGTLKANAGINADEIEWKVTKTGEYRYLVIVALDDLISAGETYDIYLKTRFDGQNGLSTNWYFRGVTQDYQAISTWGSNNHPDDMTRDHTYISGKAIEDIYKIKNYPISDTVEYFWIDIYVNLYVGDTFYAKVEELSVTQQSTAGKVGSILEYIKNLPANIKSALSSLFDGITNAINNAVSTILDGIKSLFVPTEADITAYRDQWDDLLQRRFGAIYQCVSLVQDYWKSIFPGSASSYITFPEVTLTFSGVPWTFGGFKVQLIPAGFGSIVSVLRLIVNAVCSLAFLNAMKNKYERLMD